MKRFSLKTLVLSILSIKLAWPQQEYGHRF